MMTVALPAAQAHHDGQWTALPRDGSTATDLETNETLDAFAWWDGTENAGLGVGQFHIEIYAPSDGDLIHEDTVPAVEDTRNSTFDGCNWVVDDYQLEDPYTAGADPVSPDAQLTLDLSGDYHRDICYGTIQGTLTGVYDPADVNLHPGYELDLQPRAP